MLSTAAFNALLKTLEEPPAHALFLFATTDPQKIPATVLSRVIRFDLRPIARAAIVGQLKKVMSLEKIPASPASDAALFQIARESEGGLRDALSLLDQVIAYSQTASEKGVTLPSVEAVIGISTRRFVKALSEAVIRRDAPTVLRVSDEAFQSGLDTKRLALDLLEYFRHLLVAQVTREASLFDLPQEEIEELAGLAKAIPAADLDRLFRILQKGILDLIRSPLPKVLMDVLLLRLASWESLEPLDEILNSLKGSGLRRESGLAGSAPHALIAWPDFLRSLREQSPRLAALVEQGSLVSLEDSEAVLRFPAKSMNLELLRDPDREAAFKRHLSDFFKRPLGVRYDVQATEAAGAGAESAKGGIVDDALSIFGGRTVPPPKQGAT